jgi:hypothetical protein
MWTADKTSSHADVVEPLDRVELNVASDEWRCELVVTLSISIRIAAEFSHYSAIYITNLVNINSAAK